MTFNNN